MANIEEKVENLIKKNIEDICYELYDVIYLKEGKNYTLRIVIDNEKGISLEDCEKVNNEITDILDEADYIKDQYFLEVSSPGIERLLRKDWQLNKYIGSKVEVNLFKKDEKGFKEYIGILKQVDEEYLTIKQDNTDYKILRKDISQVKTIYEEGEMENESNR
ncbi:MAG: ribosome maturation factor RimP [Clostridia bacterium]|nr:ribosome maturation factor RimP [Clostridia bacterium]